MTERSRERAVACVAKFTATFADDQDFSLIPTAELREEISRSRGDGSHSVILVDCREQDEQRTSMIPGAVTQATFETDVLPALMQQRGQQDNSYREPLVVPYCTVGYRSGLYCRELVRTHGLKHVRNGEGIIMWTFDGDGLVKPCPAAVPSRAPPLPGAVPEESAGEHAIPTIVQEVHVYGKPWDIAAEGYQTRYFSAIGGALRFLCSKLRSEKSRGLFATALPWVWVFALLYFAFTPACGIMYDCGCQFAGSKWSQFKTCNVNQPEIPHKCPWCSCSGFECIFVASDMKAFKDVPLLDMFPEGFFVTVFAVVMNFAAFTLVDRAVARTKQGLVVSTTAKVLVGFIWFVSYCLIVGAIFWAVKSDYPHFLGFERNVDVVLGAESSAPVVTESTTVAASPPGGSGGSGGGFS